MSTIELASSWNGRPRTLVMIGHWIGGVRTVTPSMAARQGVTYPAFAAANAASAAGWVGSFILAGNALSEHADQITRIAPVLGLPLIAVVLVLRWIRRRLSSQHAVAELTGRVVVFPAPAPGVGKPQPTLVLDAAGVGGLTDQLV